MVTRRRRVRTAALLVVALMVGGLVAAGSAAALPPPPPTVTIVNPVAGTTVSGQVTFTVAIEQNDAAHPVTHVYLQIFGATQGWREQIINVSPGQCAPSCTVSATFDTAAFFVMTDANPTHSSQNLSDGVAEFSATVETSFGPTGMTYHRCTIDNRRPSISLPDLPVDYRGAQVPWGGDSELSTRVVTAPNPASGQPVTSLRLMVPNYPVIPLANVSLPVPDGGSGTVTVSTTGLPVGYYLGYLAAIDASGIASELRLVAFNVGHYAISVRDAGTYSDHGALEIIPDWTDGTTAAETWIDDARVYLDGTQIAYQNGYLKPHNSLPFALNAPGGAKLPLGQHSLSVAVIDNRGIPHSLTMPITIADPVVATWKTGTIIANRPAAIGVSVFNQSTSPVLQIRLAVDGGLITTTNSHTMANPLAADSPSTTLAAGIHTVTATVLLLNGKSYDLSHQVVALNPISLALSAPSSATWGDRVRFRTQATSGTRAKAGLRVTLQSRTFGSSTWRSRAAATTDAYGAASFSLPSAATGNAYWRVISSATATQTAGTSAQRAVRVKASVGRLPGTSTIPAGRAVRYALTTRPYEARVRVLIQVRRLGTSTWTTRATSLISTTGQIRFAFSIRQPGTYYVRVIRPATNLVTQTVTPSWTVRIS